MRPLLHPSKEDGKHKLRRWGRWTYVGSLCVQVVALVLSLVAIGMFSSSGGSRILHQALVIECVVNVLQLTWYLAAPSATGDNSSLRAGPFSSSLQMPAARTRYIDWALTTPLMIISLVAASEHFLQTDVQSLGDLFGKYGLELFVALTGNAAMLLFGLIATYIPNPTKSYAIWAGFVPLAQVWVTLIWTFAVGSSSGRVWALYVSTVVLWTMYGVVAHGNEEWRAIGFNVLDTLSKNVFGIIFSVISIRASQ